MLGDTLTELCQAPRAFRLALGVTLTSVRQKPETLQAPQELRYLPLIVNIRPLADNAVAGTGVSARPVPTPARCDTSNASGHHATGPPQHDTHAPARTHETQEHSSQRPVGLARDACAPSAQPPLPNRAARSCPSNPPTDHSTARADRWTGAWKGVVKTAPTKPSAVKDGTPRPTLTLDPYAPHPRSRSGAQEYPSRHSNTRRPPRALTTTHNRASSGSRCRRHRWPSC